MSITKLGLLVLGLLYMSVLEGLFLYMFTLAFLFWFFEELFTGSNQ